MILTWRLYNQASNCKPFCVLENLTFLLEMLHPSVQEFNRPLCRASCFALVFCRGITASAARILSPNPKRRPLPCLLIQSFFYGQPWIGFGGAKSTWTHQGVSAESDSPLCYHIEEFANIQERVVFGKNLRKKAIICKNHFSLFISVLNGFNSWGVKNVLQISWPYHFIQTFFYNFLATRCW